MNMYNPFFIVHLILKNRQLIWEMSKREVLVRYKGSILGIFWSFSHPLIMLVVYTFVFGYIFKGGRSMGIGNVDYVFFLFIGIIVHSLFSECINSAPELILQNVQYVKKIIFPLDILPIVSMVSALFHAVVSFAVLLMGFFIVHHSIHLTVLLVPILLTPFACMTVGFTWILSSTGVYLRDISQMTRIITMIAMFLCPIFYSVSALPEKIRILIFLNPLTFIVIEMRNIVTVGTFANWEGLLLYYVISIAVAWLGFIWFQKIRNGFADVL